MVGSGSFGLSHPFDCNVYLINGGSELALVDAGAGVNIQSILKNIEKDELDLSAIRKIFVTHCHADHAGGCHQLGHTLKCEIIAPKGVDKIIEKGEEKALGLSRAKLSGLYSKEYTFQPTGVDKVIRDGETMHIGKIALKAIQTPGHSKFSTCYFLDLNHIQILFSGDTVGYGGRIGLLNCPGSSLSSYRESMDKLSNLDIDLLLPGHKTFILKNGQEHIDQAINYLKKLSVPPLFLKF